MRIIYKGKFKEDLNDYIEDQPWMFDLDEVGLSFWELPIAMQWGVVQDFADSVDSEVIVIKLTTYYEYPQPSKLIEYYYSLNGIYSDEDFDSYKESRIKAIQELQKWYNENK